MRTNHLGTEFDEWRERLNSVCGKFDAVPAPGNDFLGKVEKRDLNGLDLACINTNALRMAHNKRTLESDSPFCFLVFQRSGSAKFSQLGKEIAVSPGHMLLVDSASSFDIALHGFSEQFSLHLSREVVCRQLPRKMQKFGKLQIDSLSGRLLKTLVEQIIADSEREIQLQQAEGDSLQRAVISLLEPALQGTDKAALSEQLTDLRDLAVAEIDRNLKSPRLTAESLAALLNVSTRKLYRAFEKHGESIHEHVIRKRVQLAAQNLIDPNLKNRSICEIAHDLGFCDSSHFNKAFRKFYRFSPREYREEFKA